MDVLQYCFYRCCHGISEESDEKSLCFKTGCLTPASLSFTQSKRTNFEILGKPIKYLEYDFFLERVFSNTALRCRCKRIKELLPINY